MKKFFLVLIFMFFACFTFAGTAVAAMAAAIVLGLLVRMGLTSVEVNNDKKNINPRSNRLGCYSRWTNGQIARWIQIGLDEWRFSSTRLENEWKVKKMGQETDPEFYDKSFFDIPLDDLVSSEWDEVEESLIRGGQKDWALSKRGKRYFGGKYQPKRWAGLHGIELVD